MNRIVNQFFQGQTIQLDGNSYENCDFDDCTIIFRGFSGFGLQNCRFHGVRWEFADHAGGTIQALTQLYHGLGPEGRNLIEKTFDNIRRGGVGKQNSRQP